MAIAALAVFCAPAAQAQDITPDQKKAFEKVIRDYLIQNPTIIREALTALQAREEAEKQARQKQALQNRKAELVNDPAAPVAGNPKGDVTVVEFFDYNCGYCKRVWPMIGALLQADKEVRVVFKEFAILGPGSLAAAKAALAADRQGKYLEFHTELMRARGINDRAIDAIAKKLGLDVKKLRADMERPEIEAALQKNYRLAEDLGINGTPAFVIGDTMVPGAIGPEQLAAMIAAERAKKKK